MYPLAGPLQVLRGGIPERQMVDRGIAGSAAVAGARYFWIIIEPNKMVMSTV